VADADIEDIVPIMEVGGVKRVTQPAAKECESAGLVKYDFLVVAALKDINLCLKYINTRNKKTNKTGYFDHNGVKTYIWDLLEDQDVFNMLTEGKTETVFQLHTAGATPTVMKVGPKSIIDCATITSLERPGPKDHRDPVTGRNMVEEYIERKFGRSKSDIPILDEMLPETFGVLVFQEQVTKLAKELAGMNVEDSENVRIAVGKKKEDLIKSLKPIFIEGAAKKVGEETATEIWNMMETFARYGFNKSHAVGYSLISYACAYLKHHYHLEWWASVISNADDKEINEVFYKYIKDMVLPPDVNTSTEELEVDYKVNKIRNKLSVISGVGKKSAESIIASRPYKDIHDFVKKKVCGPSLTRKLIYVNALDSLFPEGAEDLTKLSLYEEAAAKVKFDEKVKDYEKKIIKAGESMTPEALAEAEKISKRLIKYQEKGPKVTEIPEEYIGINSKKSFQIKKSVFPIMNLDLSKALRESSVLPVIDTDKGSYLITTQGEMRLFKGEHLQKLDSIDVNQEVLMCVPGYILDTSVFPYHGNKQALKIIVDSSGYVSEKIIWPDYDTGELKYDPDIKKGAIAYFLYGKKPNKPYTNIKKVIIEETSIIS
jgi:DNA polymerase III alpha subunit